MSAIELSEKTLVEARPGQYGKPYIAIGRIQGKFTRWMFLSSTAWQTLATLAPQVTSIVHDGTENEIRLQLNTRVLLTICRFRDKYYVGMHSLDGEGRRVRGKGVNLDLQEWNNLFSNVANINQVMQQLSDEHPQPTKRPLSADDQDAEAKRQKTQETTGSLQPMVKQYQWRNVSPFDHTKIIRADDCWVFSQEICRKRLNDFHKLGYEVPDTSSDIVETREIPLPEDSELTRWVVLSFFRKAINDAMKEGCCGCDEGLSDPESHVQGCRMPWSDAVDRYFDRIEMSVWRISAMELFKKLKNALEVNVPVPEPGLLTIGLMIACAEQTLQNDLKAADVIPKDFCMLIKGIAN